MWCVCELLEDINRFNESIHVPPSQQTLMRIYNIYDRKRFIGIVDESQLQTISYNLRVNCSVNQ